MSLTGETFTKYFVDCGSRHNKIVFQADTDEVNCSRIVSFFSSNDSEDIAFLAVDKFMSSNSSVAVLLLDFVVSLGSIMHEIQAEKADRDNFISLVEQTRKRMESDSCEL